MSGCSKFFQASWLAGFTRSLTCPWRLLNTECGNDGGITPELVMSEELDTTGTGPIEERAPGTHSAPICHMDATQLRSKRVLDRVDKVWSQVGKISLANYIQAGRQADKIADWHPGVIRLQRTNGVIARLTRSLCIEPGSSWKTAPSIT